MTKAKKGPYDQYSEPMTIPPPIGGWNARDPLPAMKPEDAVILQNWIPGTGGVSLRTGSAIRTTGLGGSVDSLFQYNGPLAAPKLFGASGGSIYDVSAQGAVGAPAVSGFSSDDWHDIMFATPAPANWLVIANGADPVQEFNGSTWSVPTITGVTSSNLISPTALANRIFFIEKDTLRVWYLAVGAIQGAASLLDLGAECALGGHLVAMSSWSQSGGGGPADYSVFLTSAGELVIYQGTDPSSTTTWSLIGRYRIPEPIGTRCMKKAGADVAVITTLGVISLLTVLPISTSAQGQSAVTDKIKGAFQSAYAATGTLAGWVIAEYPKGALILVNIPQADGVSFQQFVMNSVTGAWCNFVGVNALSWSLFDQLLYFGDVNGNVWQYDVSNDDNSAPINFIVLPAFSNFGTVGFKNFLMARPLYTGVDGGNPPLEARVDYDQSIPTGTQTIVPDGETPWGSPWDTSSWGPIVGAIAEWQSIEGTGVVGSVILSGLSRTALTLNHIDILLESGGIF